MSTTEPYSLTEMFRRLLKADGLTRAARSVEWFGWLIMAYGLAFITAPHWVESVLHLPVLSVQGANYLRLAGLMVSGLGMLYVVSGRLNAHGFIFASLLDRPLSPVVMALFWHLDILPGGLALAFSISDACGFIWTLLAWRADGKGGRGLSRPVPAANLIAGFFGLIGAVLRIARTSDPEGVAISGPAGSLGDPPAKRPTLYFSARFRR